MVYVPLSVAAECRRTPGQELLGQIRTGDLLAFRGRWPHSRLIEWWTTSEYSHVATAWWMDAGEDGHVLCVIEALESLSGGHVQVQRLDRYLAECAKASCGVDWFKTEGWNGERSFVLDRQQRERIALYQLRHLSESYASDAQMLWSFVRLNQVIRSTFGLPANLNAERWFCSELRAHGLHAAGALPTSPEDEAVTCPGECVKFMCEHFQCVLLP